MLPRSVWTTTILACLAFSACAPRRDREDPASSAASSTAVEDSDVPSRPPRPGGSGSRVIWIGLDGLDWDWMDRLSAEGRIPHWSRLVAEGRSAKLSSFIPMLSPIVWTTMATGVGPDVHGILDFEEIDGAGRKVPISGLSRRVPALWNIASAARVKVGVVGWWATHPAEVVDGFFVSDRASPISLPGENASGASYPPALEPLVRTVIAREASVRPGDLRSYLGIGDAEIANRLTSADEMKDPVFALARVLGSTRAHQKLARDFYDHQRPDFMTVYFEGTDEIGHVFAAYTPPALACVPAADAAKFGQAAARYYAAIDAMLGQWMRRAREDGATLLVTSDHGFKWGDDRPCARSSSGWSTAAFWHRPDGVFAAWGARVVPGRNREHPSVFDVAPTVLALLGVPRDVRMTGHAVTAAFRNLPESRAENLFETTPVARVSGAPVSAAEAGENARKLRALGYLSEGDDAGSRRNLPPGGSPGMTEGAHNNLGLYERDVKRDPRAAEREFRKALEIRPGYHSPLFNLAVLHRNEGRDALARDFLFRAIAAGQPDPAGTVLEWAAQYRSAKKAAAERALLERAAAEIPADERVARALADSRFRQHDCAGADALLARFADETRAPETLSGLALYETCLGHPARARELFRRSLAMKPDQPGVGEALRTLER